MNPFAKMEMMNYYRRGSDSIAIVPEGYFNGLAQEVAV